MQWCHLDPGRLEIHISSFREQDFDTFHAFFVGLWRLGDHTFGTQVALVANKEQWRAPVVILFINVHWFVVGPPIVYNPSKASWVTVLSCFMDWKVSIFVVSVEYLIFLAFFFRLLKDFVEILWFAVRTLRNGAHKG